MGAYGIKACKTSKSTLLGQKQTRDATARMFLQTKKADKLSLSAWYYLE
ncbi:MAG: hypothetical protein ACJAZ3_000418 [Sphingobacteriales bacterium]|jgi:hypothetical protein